MIAKNSFSQFVLIVLGCSSVFAEMQPTKTRGVVEALVTDFQNNALSGQTVTFVGQSSGESCEGVTNPQGVFETLCPGGESFKVYYQSLVGPYEVGQFDFPNPPYKGSINVQFENKTVTLRDVLFDSGKATLQNSSFVELRKLAQGLKSESAIRVEIAGHTDDIGEEEANLKLSQSRAETVKNFLVDQGIQESRLVAVGYGESQPVQSNATAEGRAANRRTEVRILEEDQK